jgi:hypothetical protein
LDDQRIANLDAALSNLEIGLKELKDWRANDLSSLIGLGDTAIHDLRLVLDDLQDAAAQLQYAEVGGLN